MNGQSFTEESLLEVSHEMLQDLRKKIRVIQEKADAARQKIWDENDLMGMYSKLSKLEKDINLARSPLSLGDKIKTPNGLYEVFAIMKGYGIYSPENAYLGDLKDFKVWCYSIHENGIRKVNKHNEFIERGFKMDLAIKLRLNSPSGESILGKGEGQ